ARRGDAKHPQAQRTKLYPMEVCHITFGQGRQAMGIYRWINRSGFRTKRQRLDQVHER
ncbi:hypothetical protein FRC11_011778, partial [Ceratobasidium sp. 423]